MVANSRRTYRRLDSGDASARSSFWPIAYMIADMRQALVSILVVLSGVRAGAQTPPAPVQNPEPFKILDNSFLVEEAFNQEPGVVQNIFGFTRSSGLWAFSFTQEWPVPGETHQLSYTLALAGGDGGTRFGDVLLNYRYQVCEESRRRPAFAPRVSAILPTAQGRVTRSPGLQVNLPFSKQHRDVYFHWNAGFTAQPSAAPELTASGDSPPNKMLVSPQLAASAIWRTRPMFHLMFETVYTSEQRLEQFGARRRANLGTISPGFRTGWNVGEAQIIWGAAAPITFGDGSTVKALFLYFSYESRIWGSREGK